MRNPLTIFLYLKRLYPLHCCELSRLGKLAINETRREAAALVQLLGGT
jgi:hypothetical protein